MNTGRIVTVTGEIPAPQLGTTLAHEHLYCDISIHSGKPDNRVMDVSLMVNELQYFLKAGGRSIIEVTPEGVGRDIGKLREISQASGVQIVSGISFYDESTYPDWVRTSTVDQIADFFVRHLEEGIDGVRAGLIGELMSHNEPQPDPAGYRLRDGETLVFQAAAKAQRRTDVCITTHAALGRAGHAQLDVLEKAGANTERIIIGHCDAHWHENTEQDMEYYLPILNRGAYCQFDLIGWNELAPDDVRANRITALLRLGFANKITLSTDTCRLSQLRRNGGRGFDYLLNSFLPLLRQRGVSESQIHSMLVDAPRCVLAGRTSG